jgi:DNA-3-methyladenine glycosylase
MTVTWSPRRSRPDGGLTVLPRAFFDRPASEVAPGLLGCVLVHDSPAGPVAVTLVETEAYAGRADPASHAFRGKTARTAVMFGPAGHAYVYFTYGMHFCVNLVCLGEGEASAVLLRAGRVIQGAALARGRRAGRPAVAAGPGARAAATGRDPARGAAGPGSRGVRADCELARGPARLCRALAITRPTNGADACDPGSPLRICAGPAAVPASSISQGPRVGVSRAADVAWRFWISGEPCVSPYRPYQPRRASTRPVPAAGRDGGSMQQ